MIAALNEWLRKQLRATPYDPGSDPVVQHLRELRAEAIREQRESRHRQREARLNPIAQAAWPENGKDDTP